MNKKRTKKNGKPGPKTPKKSPAGESDYAKWRRLQDAYEKLPEQITP